MRMNDLDTPALILDRSRLEANVRRMSRRARDLGVDLRPHVKTAKCLEVARLATAGHSGAITVSTLREAEHFAAGGFTDVLYAVGIAPAKLPRVAALRRRGVRLTIVTDDVDVAAAIAARAQGTGETFDVLVEVDCGDGRAGIDPDGPALLAVARTLASAPGVTVRGVLTHGGHAYGCDDEAAVAGVAEQERAGAVRAARRLRAGGFPCPVVSVGSTPTALHGRHLDGVTELRAGVYVFGDVFQAGVGSCAIEDIALSVLTTVTSRHPERQELIVDAGGLALSKDRSTAGTTRDIGYGLVVDVEGRPSFGELVVSRVSQEHGVVTATQGTLPLDRLPPGTPLRILPNHACFTAAAYEGYHVVAGAPGAGAAVVATWSRVNGW